MKIIDIEGVGEVYATKLHEAGIKTVDELLEKGATPKGREELAEITGIAGAHIMRWINHADLMRVLGIGPQMAELLEASGVDSVPELRHRVAENLHAKMVEVNGQKNLVGRNPGLSQVAAWIERCQAMERKVNY